jgi:beta-galactosidase
MPIRIDSDGLFLDERFLPLYSGTVHYWRHPQDKWKGILEQIKQTGFRVVAIDIPWGTHEAGPSIFEFGAKDPARNLGQFIDYCRELGLYLIIHPGPHQELDVPWAGIPARIVRNSAFWALTSTGTPALLDAFPQPFPLISYANNRLYTEFSKFLDVLCPILVPRQYPNGPIILCQAGGTIDFGKRYRAYDIDYSAESLTLYRQFLTDKYHRIETLNEIYSSNFNNFNAIQPPKSFTAASHKDYFWCTDWIAYKESLGVESAKRIAPLLRARGISIPLFHAVHPTTSPADHYSLLASTESQMTGIEVTPALDRLPEFAFQLRHTAGTHPFPYAASFPQGADWLSAPLLSPSEQEFIILFSIMFGLSGMNFRMLVENDGWSGSPFTRQGQERGEYAALHRRLLNFITSLRVFETKKLARCLVMLHHDIERFHLSVSDFDLAYLGLLPVPETFSQIPHGLTFEVDPFPLSIREKNKNWLADLLQLFQKQQIEYNVTDSDAPLRRLNNYEMVFMPMADFVRQSDFEKLLDYVQRGGHLVLGPGMPSLNEKLGELILIKVIMGQLMYKFERMQSPGTITMGNGKFTWQNNIDAIEELLPTSLQNPILHDNPSLFLTIREGPHNLMFLANPTHEDQTTSIISTSTLKGVWNLPEKQFKGIFQAIVRPLSVQVMEVLP